MIHLTQITYILFLSLFTQCGGPMESETEIAFSAEDFMLPYHMKEPVATYMLTHELQEISGLSFSADRSTLLAVQDEEGYVFELEKSSGKVLRKLEFHKDGDYEGIEVVGQSVFVVKSNGNLYEIKNLGSPEQSRVKHKFFLEKKNDIEGLGYDALENRLLLACKGWPATGESFEENKGKKVVYAYDLETEEMAFDPVYTIRLQDIHQHLGKSKLEKQTEKLMDFFQGTEGSLTFNPSALAVHPLTGHLYITSSAGKILMVLDRTGRLLHLEKLKKKLLPQPEGLVFDQDGTLYVATEGKDGEGRILVYKMGSW